MNYESPGLALVSGIEAGQNIVLKGQEYQDRKEQMAYERDRQGRIDKMNEAHMALADDHIRDEDQRQLWKTNFEANTTWGKDLSARYETLRKQYVKPDGTLNREAFEADPQFSNLGGEKDKFNLARHALYNGLAAPTVNDGINRARDTTEQMNNGQFDPTDPANAQDLFHWNAVMYRQDPANLMPGSGSTYQSRFDMGRQTLEDGIKNQDKGKIADGLDQVFGTQLEAGRLGYMDPYGGIVTSAKVNRDAPYVPTPDGKGMYPVMTLNADHPDGSISTQPAAAPTTGGFNHPDNSDLHVIDPAKMFNQLGGMIAVHTIMQHPLAQSNLYSAIKNPSKDTLDWAALYSMVGESPGEGQKIMDINGQAWSFEKGEGGKYGKGVALTPPQKQKPERAETSEQALLDSQKRMIGKPIDPGDLTKGVYTQDYFDRLAVTAKEQTGIGKLPPEAAAKDDAQYASDSTGIDQGRIPEGGGMYSRVDPQSEEGKAEIENAHARLDAGHKAMAKWRGNGITIPHPKGAGAGAGVDEVKGTGSPEEANRPPAYDGAKDASAPAGTARTFRAGVFYKQPSGKWGPKPPGQGAPAAPAAAPQPEMAGAD